jgi:stalled ribosome rescue protein Dom34
MRTPLVLVILLSGFVATAQSKQEQVVLQLSHAKFKWLVQKKIDSLKVVLDDRLTYIHSNGWMQTKNELIADLISGKLTYESIEVDQDSIRIYPKSAVVTGRGKFVATLNGSTNTFDLTYTETYVLQKREWKLVSRHASRAQ